MVNRVRETGARKSLWAKAGEGLPEEERCDILLSLVGLIEDGKDIGNGPEDILLDGDNEVQIARLRQSGKDLIFQAPEVIWGTQEGHSPEAAPDQKWFTLGMLAYFMYYGTDYYTDHQIRLLESQEQLFTRRYIISPPDAARIPFGKAVSQLTAVDGGERVQGLTAFLAYLSEQMPETAKIRYLCGEQTVYEEERILYQDIDDLAPGGMLTLNGTAYRTVLSGGIQIPYRPGTHRYDVKVTAAVGNPEPDMAPRFSPRYPSETAGTHERWVYVKQSHLTGDLGYGEQMIRVLKLGGEDRNKQLELHMQYPDSRISVFRTGAGGEKELWKEIPILKESDPRIASCFVQLRYKAASDNLWITVKGPDNTPLHTHGIDLGETQ